MKRLILSLFLPALLVPWWCGRRADAHFDGDRDAWLPLADAVSHLLLEDPVVTQTGSSRFDGEWTLGACALGVLGLSAVVERFPDTAERYGPALDHCSSRLVSPEIRSFATDAWGDDAFENLDDPAPRDAWLGYVLSALAAHEQVRPGGGTEWLDPIGESLERRLSHPLHRLQTYPQESYPCDQSTVIGGVARWARVRGRPLPDPVQDAANRFESEAVDPDTGWVFQARSSRDGAALDGPRGSGSALSAYFLHAADPDLSRQIYTAHRDRGRRSTLFFGAMREYPPGVFGWGDIDSGPVIAGVSVSATGFSLSGARLHGDRQTYRRLFRTTWLFGAPIRTPYGRPFATGGTLGNAILLAMLTAGPSTEPSAVASRRSP